MQLFTRDWYNLGTSSDLEIIPPQTCVLCGAFAQDKRNLTLIYGHYPWVDRTGALAGAAQRLDMDIFNVITGEPVERWKHVPYHMLPCM